MNKLSRIVAVLLTAISTVSAKTHTTVVHHHTETKTEETIKTKKAVHESKTQPVAQPVHTIHAQKELVASTKTAATVLNKQFSAWSKGSDVLTRQRVLNLLKDPNIQGQDAAVLAALVVEVNNSKDKQFTLVQLQKGLSNQHSAIYHYYITALNNINGVRKLATPMQRLWGPSGKLSSKTHIIQMSEDDCYFLSAVNSMLLSNPQKLQSMITRTHQDTYSVKFPGDPVAEKVKLTKTELGMYSKLIGGGEWLAVMSVAEAQRRVRLRLDPEITMQPGYQTQTMALLTGKKYVLKNIPNNPTTAQTQELENLINQALTAKPQMPIGIETSVHDLSIIGYNKATGTLTIKNPWGTNGWYNPVTAGWSTSSSQPTSSGPWYLMKRGVFTIPMSQISNGFGQIAYHPADEG